MSAVEYLAEFMAMVNYDGSVFYAPMVNLQSRCHIDPTVEEQICPLKVSSEGLAESMDCFFM